jgi:chemotaxis protein MotB
MGNRHQGGVNVWPGFVDALASLLIVIIFVMMGSVLTQMKLFFDLSDSDESLKLLKQTTQKTQEQLDEKNAEVLVLREEMAALKSMIELLQRNEKQWLLNERALIQHRTALEEQLKKTGEANLTLEARLAQKLDEYKAVYEQLSDLKKQIPDNILKNPELLRYRSEFFETLQDVLGGRSDIRVVGDRFVFQAEVLFDQGSAELGEKGQAVLDTVVEILKDLSRKMPSHLTWVLRVDGHTDQVPIHNDRFQSNWELSIARALCVVKYMIQRGLPAKNLAAAGFSEYFPLEKEKTKIAKNRRIELRFDQR